MASRYTLLRGKNCLDVVLLGVLRKTLSIGAWDPPRQTAVGIIDGDRCKRCGLGLADCLYHGCIDCPDLELTSLRRGLAPEVIIFMSQHDTSHPLWGVGLVPSYAERVPSPDTSGGEEACGSVLYPWTPFVFLDGSVFQPRHPSMSTAP